MDGFGGSGPDHVGGRPAAEDPDPIDLARGLGGGGAGPREGREGEAAEEGAPVHEGDGAAHWISSSARTSNADGMVSPSAFAVLRLMTSSYRLGDSTGQGGRAGAAEDPVDVDGRAAELLGEARRVGHETSQLGELPQRVDARQPVLAGQLGDALSLREQEGVTRRQQRVDAIPDHGRERGSEVVAARHLAELDLHPEGPPGGLVLAQAHRRGGAVQHGHAREPGQGLLEELELLAADLGVSCWLRPVTLPPGRAKLATSPASTGSVALTMTIGIVVVARLAASAGAWEEATITSTLCRTRSAASSARRSRRPSAQRYSMTTFLPST